MKKLISILIFLLSGSFTQAQGIEFFKGNFEEALTRAKVENKILFVDCYASWCGPCKTMSEQVFTDLGVATYANEKFINFKLDVEAPENKAIVKEYKISAMPTLIFLSSDKKMINRSLGAMDVNEFMRLMKVTTGEIPSFSQLFSMIGKEEDKNSDLTREFLLVAPKEINAIPEDEKAKWVARVESTYSKYIKSKPLDQFINKEDFMIIASFNNVSKGNELFKFMCENHDKFKTVFGDNTPTSYIIQNHSALMIQMAQKGDGDYVIELERMRGDLKDVYAELKTSASADVYTLQKQLLDATFTIYGKKDIAAYIDLINQYFIIIGDDLKADDYEQATLDMYRALGGKLSSPAYNKCIEWLTKGMTFKLSEMKQIQYMIMLADCYTGLDDKAKAKGMYNKAYILAMQTGDTRSQNMIKMQLEKLDR